MLRRPVAYQHGRATISKSCLPSHFLCTYKPAVKLRQKKIKPTVTIASRGIEDSRH